MRILDQTFRTCQKLVGNPYIMRILNSFKFRLGDASAASSIYYCLRHSHQTCHVRSIMTCQISHRDMSCQINHDMSDQSCHVRSIMTCQIYILCLRFLNLNPRTVRILSQTQTKMRSVRLNCHVMSDLSTHVRWIMTCHIRQSWHVRWIKTVNYCSWVVYWRGGARVAESKFCKQ